MGAQHLTGLVHYKDRMCHSVDPKEVGFFAVLTFWSSLSLWELNFQGTASSS